MIAQTCKLRPRTGVKIHTGHLHQNAQYMDFLITPIKKCVNFHTSSSTKASIFTPLIAKIDAELTDYCSQ
jgi:hypothetical protein